MLKESRIVKQGKEKKGLKPLTDKQAEKLLHDFASKLNGRIRIAQIAIVSHDGHCNQFQYGDRTELVELSSDIHREAIKAGMSKEGRDMVDGIQGLMSLLGGVKKVAEAHKSSGAQ